MEQHKHIFAKCPKCKRPYKKTEKYPDEVCPVCEDTPDLPTEEEILEREKIMDEEYDPVNHHQDSPQNRGGFDTE